MHSIIQINCCLHRGNWDGSISSSLNDSRQISNNGFYVSEIMTDLVGTIESGDEIDYMDESDDEFEEKIYTKKDRAKTT